MDVKKAVGVLESKSEGAGNVTVAINVGSKYPLKVKAWTQMSKDDPRPTPIVEHLAGVKAGQRVEVTFTEKAGEYMGKPVTYRNLVGIALVTDSTPNCAPAPSEKPKADGQTIPHHAPDERGKAITWMSCFNNACSLYGPIMLSEYNSGTPWDEEQMSRHLKNIDALAAGLHDFVIAATDGK